MRFSAVFVTFSFSFRCKSIRFLKDLLTNHLICTNFKAFSTKLRVITFGYTKITSLAGIFRRFAGCYVRKTLCSRATTRTAAGRCIMPVTSAQAEGHIGMRRCVSPSDDAQPHGAKPGASR